MTEKSNTSRSPGGRTEADSSVAETPKRLEGAHSLDPLTPRPPRWSSRWAEWHGSDPAVESGLHWRFGISETQLLQRGGPEY